MVDIDPGGVVKSNSSSSTINVRLPSPTTSIATETAAGDPDPGHGDENLTQRQHHYHGQQQSSHAAASVSQKAGRRRSLSVATAEPSVETVIVKAKRAASSLWMLLHAQNCSHVKNCPHPGCQEAKLLHLHLKTCPSAVGGADGFGAGAGSSSSCPTHHHGCEQARKLLAHYRRCRALRARQTGHLSLPSSQQRREPVQQHCLVCSLVARHARSMLLQRQAAASSSKSASSSISSSSTSVSLRKPSYREGSRANAITSLMLNTTKALLVTPACDSWDCSDSTESNMPPPPPRPWPLQQQPPSSSSLSCSVGERAGNASPTVAVNTVSPAAPATSAGGSNSSKFSAVHFHISGQTMPPVPPPTDCYSNREKQEYPSKGWITMPPPPSPTSSNDDNCFATTGPSPMEDVTMTNTSSDSADVAMLSSPPFPSLCVGRTRSVSFADILISAAASSRVTNIEDSPCPVLPDAPVRPVRLVRRRSASVGDHPQSAQEGCETILEEDGSQGSKEDLLEGEFSRERTSSSSSSTGWH